jgi:hypothetical protein
MQTGGLSDYPVALIKSGILSGWFTIDSHEFTYLIDSYGNAGFSGGPVLKSGAAESVIVGIVSGGYPDTIETILKLNQDGDTIKEEGLFFRPQSGFVRFNGISHFVELVDQMK